MTPGPAGGGCAGSQASTEVVPSRPIGYTAWGDDETDRPVVAFSLGRWSARLTIAGVEDLQYDGTPVLARLFYSVRGTDWSTEASPWEIVDMNANGISISARFREHGLLLSGYLDACGSALSFETRLQYEGREAEQVALARAGPALLHPGTDAGCRVRGSGGAAAAFQSVLPIHVSPGPILPPCSRLEIDGHGKSLSVRLKGGLLETEDHRNWGDDGFKTYTPPLAAPRPILVSRAAPLRHKLWLAAVVRNPGPVTTRARGGGPSARVGVLPLLGFQHSGGRLPQDAREAIRDLRPAFLHLVADLHRTDWSPVLRADASLADDLDLPIVLSLAARPEDDHALCAVPRVLGERLRTVLAFDHDGAGSSPRLVRRVRAVVGDDVRVGGGSRGHLSTLLAMPPAIDELEVLSFPVAACAHDLDRSRVLQALASHGDMVSAARRVAGARPLLVGPVGFLPSWNPWSPASDGPVWGPGSPRQQSVLAAAWTVAFLASMVNGAVEEISLHHTVGGRGVGSVENGAFQPYPVWFALREFGRAAGRNCTVSVAPTGASRLTVGGSVELMPVLRDGHDAEVRDRKGAVVLHAVAENVRITKVQGGPLPVPSVVMRWPIPLTPRSAQ
jgi:D-apionolactonase